MKDNIILLWPEQKPFISIPLSSLENFCKALEMAKDTDAASFVCGAVYAGLSTVIAEAKEQLNNQ